VRFLVPALVALLLAVAPAPARRLQDPGTPEPAPVLTPDLDAVAWRHSRALGRPFAHGRLVDGVQLPELGQDYFTWDPVLNRSPDRGWRRWGTDRLVRTVLTVIEQYRAERSSAQRVGIMDLSREHGGPFGRNYGGLGHASHQNGLDADVLYPRNDGREARATRPAQVDQPAAQDLLDRFVAAGAVKVFVGPHLHLHGPKNVVVPLIYHDDHMHVRIR
jgi:murein endopeptidase